MLVSEKKSFQLSKNFKKITSKTRNEIFFGQTLLLFPKAVSPFYKFFFLLTL